MNEQTVPDMKLTRPRGQRWFLVVLIAVAALYFGYRQWAHRDITVHWKEEVLLADGSRMWIKREILTGVVPGIQRGVKAFQIRIPTVKGDVVWEYPLSPMILERGKATGSWVLIAIPGFCEEFYRYGSPKPPYIQFGYVNGQWSHKHVSPEWYGKRANLSSIHEPNYEQFSKREGKSFAAGQIREFLDQLYPAKELIVVDEYDKSNCYERE